MSCVQIDDYQYPGGWRNPGSAAARSRWACEQLENGEILSFPKLPFVLPEEDRQFLLPQRQSKFKVHKNISYRPKQDALRGFASDEKEDAERLRDIMRRFSANTVQFVSQVLAPYASKWALDFATYRPEEEGRDLPLNKRNDLLHVDAFPSRPIYGGRILRVFTNINPEKPRVWNTTDRFAALLARFSDDVGAKAIVAKAGKGRALRRSGAAVLKALGLRVPYRSPYDVFMLRFHAYLKANGDFQQNCKKIRTEFPPMSTWMVFTDDVPHAVPSGQFALEQTFIIPQSALVAPEKSPLRVLEALCGPGLAD